MTHTVTHTRKRADGDNGIKRIKDLILLGRKGLKDLISQHFEVFQSLGKDEVGDEFVYAPVTVVEFVNNLLKTGTN